MRVLIHVGYPKTASTWFQESFFPKLNNFRFVEQNDIIKHLINPGALDFNSFKARAFFLNKYKGNLFLSHENFVGTTHNFGLNGYLTNEHANRLKLVFPEAEIIVFIRNQYDIIASSYYQYIFSGGTYSLKRYLHTRFEGLYGIAANCHGFFEFDKTIKLYEDLFSKEKVSVFLFENFERNNIEFLKLFCERLHFQIEFEKISYKPKNKKLRFFTKVLFKLFNLFTIESVVNKYYLVNIPFWHRLYRSVLIRLNRYSFMGKHTSSFNILGKKNYQFISDYYKTSNQKLIESHGIKQILEFNYPV